MLCALLCWCGGQGARDKGQGAGVYFYYPPPAPPCEQGGEACDLLYRMVVVIDLDKRSSLEG